MFPVHAGMIRRMTDMSDITIMKRLVPAEATLQLIPAGARVRVGEAARQAGIAWRVVATPSSLRDRLGQGAYETAMADAIGEYGDEPSFCPFLYLVEVGATPESVTTACHEALSLPNPTVISVEAVPDDYDEEAGSWG